MEAEKGTWLAIGGLVALGLGVGLVVLLLVVTAPKPLTSVPPVTVAQVPLVTPTPSVTAAPTATATPTATVPPTPTATLNPNASLISQVEGLDVDREPARVIEIGEKVLKDASLRRDPNYPATLARIVTAYSNRGIGFYSENKLDEAFNDFNRALELDGRNARAYYLRGLVYYQRVDYDRALGDFNRALELNPRYVEALLQRGVVYYQRRELDTALRDLDAALKLAPDGRSAPLVYYMQGLSHRDKGDTEAARRSFQQAANRGYEDAKKELDRLPAS